MLIQRTDLASHCRLLLHDRPRYKHLIRYGVLYPLYVLSEVAIVSTDLAELLGSAIGLCLLFPAIPLWAAVLITASDVLIFLILGDPSRGHGRPVKVFEITVMSLVSVVSLHCLQLSMWYRLQWSLCVSSSSWSEWNLSGRTFFSDMCHRKTYSKPNRTPCTPVSGDSNLRSSGQPLSSLTFFTAVGILGATVMPHALFLGSYLATQDRVGLEPTLPDPAMSSPSPSNFRGRLRVWFRSLFTISRAERIAASRDYRDKYGRENNELGFVRAHISHGLVDVIVSLMTVAVPINSA